MEVRKISNSSTSTEVDLIEPIHPGEVLMEDFIKGFGITQHKLAVSIGVPPRRINEIVHGKRGVTADTAIGLARYFGTSEVFWMNLQSHYGTSPTVATPCGPAGRGYAFSGPRSGGSSRIVTLAGRIGARVASRASATQNTSSTEASQGGGVGPEGAFQSGRRLAISAATRSRISSRIVRTASIPCPAGSSSCQSS
ncbi:HigA family addiction module antitoxin [Enemella evansiae]|nr:HigA family addiction module antitoxin [Enemella evansiae]